MAKKRDSFNVSRRSHFELYTRRLSKMKAILQLAVFLLNLMYKGHFLFFEFRYKITNVAFEHLNCLFYFRYPVCKAK